MPSLATAAPMGTEDLPLDLMDIVWGTVVHGVRAARIQAAYFASSERTSDWYMEPGVELAPNCSRQLQDTAQALVSGTGPAWTFGSVKIVVYRPSLSKI
jgi:hypothetical protein